MPPPYDFSLLNQTTKAVISITDQYHFQKVANIACSKLIESRKSVCVIKNHKKNTTLRNRLKGADFAFVHGKTAALFFFLSNIQGKGRETAALYSIDLLDDCRRISINEFIIKGTK